MNQEHPPELKSFNRRTGIQALLVFTIPATAGSLAFYRQEAFSADDDIQRYLMMVVWLGIPAFMLMILYRTLMARPVCPDCGAKMKEEETIDIDGASWRIVHCAKCKTCYRVHGLTAGT